MADDLDKALLGLEAKGESWVGGLTDRNVRPAIILLTKAVRSLDKTSTELTRTNIRLTRTYTWLTAVLLLVGIVQIWLMVRGH